MELKRQQTCRCYCGYRRNDAVRVLEVGGHRPPTVRKRWSTDGAFCDFHIEVGREWAPLR